MPKHIIEFNLPEENEELNTTLKASKYFSMLTDMSEYLRRMTKYGTHPKDERELNSDETAIVQEIRNYFYDCLKDNDLSDECI